MVRIKLLTLKGLTSIYKITKQLINTRASLVTLSIICFFNFGCGKKVENTLPEEEVRRPTLNTSFLKLVAFFSASEQNVNQMSLGENSVVQIDADAFVRIPEYLNVLEGNAGNQFARIYFELPGEYSFYCSYQGGASSSNPTSDDEIERGLFYQLDDCYEDVNNDGEAEALGYYPGYEAAIDKNSQVRLEVLGAASGYRSKIEAQLEIDWH